MAIRYEPTGLFPKIPDPIAGGGAKEIFNAALAGQDHGVVDRPLLAEALPKLNTDTWRVLPGGEMETTYRLRQGLTWHDGQPLTSDDFVFAWKAYTEPGLGVFRALPQNLMEEVSAPDAHTVVIRWKSPYKDADILGADFPPLPRHILNEPFFTYQQDPTTRDAFLNHPFWSVEYVGPGPYRLERWEPGVALYAAAFPGYVFGRSKIDRIVARVFADENAVLSNVLAGEIHATTVYSLRFEHGMVLKREWESANKGVVLLWPTSAVHALVQFRPEYQKTPALLDLRVRKALNHSIDRQALQDGLFDGQGAIAHAPVWPDESYFPEVDRVIAKYPYDRRRTEAMMNEAGFSKDRDGFFANAAGERFRPDFQVLAGAGFERHGAIMAETWERAGIQTEFSVLPTVRSRDPVHRHTFPGIGGAGAGLTRWTGGGYTLEATGTPENNWTGGNRGGYSNPDYEALSAAFNTTLDRSERERLLVQIAKLISDHLPAFTLYYQFQVIAHTAALRGLNPTNLWWSVHQWEFR